jgi:hypothetical protein
VAAMTLPDLVEEDRFWPILMRTLECLTTTLDAANGPARCYTGFMIGDQASPLGVMNCKDGKCGGVAWVRPVQAFPSDPFPQPAEGQACVAPLAMTIEIGVARCAPRAQGQNMYPDPQEMFNALRLYMADMRALRKTICCVKGHPDAREFLFAETSWDPIPVGAGVSGGSMVFTVG